MDLAHYTDELVTRLTMTNRFEGFEDLFVVLLRHLAEGHPVSPETLARDLDWPVERVTTALQEAVSVERDDDGTVVGYGLTLRETVHAFEIDGQRLYTWCAFDTLFLPALINRTAHVVSRCAATGATVSLTVTPSAIHEVEPQDAAVSLIMPQNTTDIRHAFCCHVHFFASTIVARDWVTKHPGIEIVTVHDAFALSRELAQRLLRSTP